MLAKKKILFVYLMSSLMLVIFGCSSSEEATTEDKTVKISEEEIIVPDIKLDIKEIYCWVDLMPGGSNRFQISGDVNVTDSYKYDLDFLKLKAVRIFQEKKLIFSIKPKIKIDENAVSKDGKNFVFSTIKGLSIHQGYNIDKQVDIKMIFEDNGKSFEYNIFQQNVEKVY